MYYDMSSKAKDIRLPLADTLRDLALLRAFDLDVASSILAQEHTQSSVHQSDAVDGSREFIDISRRVLKLHGSGGVDIQEEKVEAVRNKLEALLDGL